jgi:hypothetical protein
MLKIVVRFRVRSVLANGPVAAIPLSTFGDFTHLPSAFFRASFRLEYMRLLTDDHQLSFGPTRTIDACSGVVLRLPLTVGSFSVGFGAWGAQNADCQPLPVECVI